MKSKYEILNYTDEEYANCRVEGHLESMGEIIAEYTKKYQEGELADDEYFEKMYELATKLKRMVDAMKSNSL